jgi:hypothetical protein
VTITATVSIGDASGTPTGTVSFYVDPPTTATCSSGLPASPTASGTLSAISPYQATFQTATLGIGSHAILACYPGDTHFASSSGTTAVTVSAHLTSTSVNCLPSTVSVGTPTTCTATVTDTTSPGATPPTGMVSFNDNGGGGSFDHTSCTLSGSGASASCPVNYTPAASGSPVITANYGDDGTHVSSSGSIKVTATLRTTTTAVACQPSPDAVGVPAKCAATVTDPNSAGATAPTGTVGFTDNGAGGSLSGNGSCILTTASPNSASCSVTYTPPGPGSPKITASYGGDKTHAGSIGSTTLTVVPFAASGSSFVLGDGSAISNSQVTWWGAQWAKQDNLSGGSAPASFKGFAANMTPASSGCGGAWTTGPGNSSGPPATVPSQMAVIVSGSISKSGDTISGNIVHIVIVQTDPGYAADPGHAGTGKVVSQVC